VLFCSRKAGSWGLPWWLHEPWGAGAGLGRRKEKTPLLQLLLYFEALDFNSRVSEAENFTALSRTTSPSFKRQINFGCEPELLFVDLRSIQRC